MRDLEHVELEYVSGGCHCAPKGPESGKGSSPQGPSRMKGNNGFGNGGGDGVPGKSGFDDTDR